jgi:FG-GAP-like repeat/CobQ/CobB/MinD/ParA nucleotide binding domain
MEADGKPGQVVTFYSYKGGTGRTMALANVACVLASSYSKRVLAVDWDLEAPGLHRYFENLLQNPTVSSRGDNKKSDEGPGLIELLEEIRRLVELDLGKSVISPGRAVQSQANALKCIAKLDIHRYVSDTSIQGLQIIKAGEFKDSYARSIGAFPWEALYKCSPWIFSALEQRLAEMFDFVLIDSRTGLTDTSGICTLILPQILVVVFTPNRQSFFGAVELAEKAATYRRRSSDVRPLLIIPLVSRVEAAKPELRNIWRFGDGKDWGGYQPGFESFFEKIYDLDKISLKAYFDRIQIQHIPDYAYGEPIAVLIEKSDDPYSLKGAYHAFCARLIDEIVPWDVPDELAVQTAQRDAAERRALDAEKQVQKAKSTTRHLVIFLTSLITLLVIFALYARPTVRHVVSALESFLPKRPKPPDTLPVHLSAPKPFKLGSEADIARLGARTFNPNFVGAADFNRDRKLDIVSANQGTNNISILLGNGDSTFQVPRLFAAGSFPYALVIEDFNRDGFLDVAVSNAGDVNGNGSSISVLLGNGDGTFRAPQNYPFPPGVRPTQIGVGDFDSDGIPDLVVGNWRDNKIRILMGNGDGTFKPPREVQIDVPGNSTVIPASSESC